MNLAFALTMDRRWEPAQAEYQRALSLDPSSPLAKARLDQLNALLAKRDKPRDLRPQDARVLTTATDAPPRRPEVVNTSATPTLPQPPRSLALRDPGLITTVATVAPQRPRPQRPSPRASPAGRGQRHAALWSPVDSAGGASPGRRTGAPTQGSTGPPAPPAASPRPACAASGRPHSSGRILAVNKPGQAPPNGREPRRRPCPHPRPPSRRRRPRRTRPDRHAQPRLPRLWRVPYPSRLRPRRPRRPSLPPGFPRRSWPRNPDPIPARVRFPRPPSSEHPVIPPPRGLGEDQPSPSMARPRAKDRRDRRRVALSRRILASECAVLAIGRRFASHSHRTSWRRVRIHGPGPANRGGPVIPRKTRHSRAAIGPPRLTAHPSGIRIHDEVERNPDDVAEMPHRESENLGRYRSTLVKERRWSEFYRE